MLDLTDSVPMRFLAVSGELGGIALDLHEQQKSSPIQVCKTFPIPQILPEQRAADTRRRALALNHPLCM